jgi:hypothetical protein
VRILGVTASSILKVTSSYESIASATGTGSSGTISFTSIPSTYKHLQIRVIGRSTAGSLNDDINVQFNGDTGSNYSRHYIQGAGGGVSAGGSASQTYIRSANYLTGSTIAANIYGVSIFDIIDYASTTKNKTVSSFGGYSTNGTTDPLLLSSGAWFSTAAINSITLSFGSAIASTGNSFALYGIKG